MNEEKVADSDTSSLYPVAVGVGFQLAVKPASEIALAAVAVGFGGRVRAVAAFEFPEVPALFTALTR
jgi:hypothetical protein